MGRTSKERRARAPLARNAKALVLFVGLGACGLSSVGCGESELEPRTSFEASSGMRASAVDPERPAPLDDAFWREAIRTWDTPPPPRRRSISLGFIGDAPLPGSATVPGLMIEARDVHYGGRVPSR